jgi:hypothetical protein
VAGVERGKDAADVSQENPGQAQQAAERARPVAAAHGEACDGQEGKRLSALEVQLRKTLAEMGLSRARRVFAQVEASFED